MNTRLQTRFTEPEILSIFIDVVEAVAFLHHQLPQPIIHRDIKIENVLIDARKGVYKLCDFGSATTTIIPPGTVLPVPELKRLETELDKMTTIQYRSPEQCDLYQRKGLTEKVDIWALGIFLYKLCFFTTPFENGNKMSITHARYTVPAFPAYSKEFLSLMDGLIQAEPSLRPTAVTILSQVAKMKPNYHSPTQSIPQVPSSAVKTKPLPPPIIPQSAVATKPVPPSMTAPLMIKPQPLGAIESRDPFMRDTSKHAPFMQQQLDNEIFGTSSTKSSIPNPANPVVQNGNSQSFMSPIHQRTVLSSSQPSLTTNGSPFLASPIPFQQQNASSTNKLNVSKINDRPATQQPQHSPQKQGNESLHPNDPFQFVKNNPEKAISFVVPPKNMSDKRTPAVSASSVHDSSTKMSRHDPFTS